MTHGFEQLAERVREYTPERVAAWTGMTAAEIEQLAREYATTRPAALRMNYGVQRSENGGTAVRAIAMLPALTGAWKHRGGGGVSFPHRAASSGTSRRWSGPTWRWLRRWAVGARGEYVGAGPGADARLGQRVRGQDERRERRSACEGAVCL